MSKKNHQYLKKLVAPFEKSSTKSSTRQILNTFLPFFLLWFAAYLSLNVSFWLSLLFSVPASGFLVRIFIIFHDCCHQSFFKSRKKNDILGFVSGVLTLFPYEKWKREHSIHHATNGNLNKRGTGDIWVLTVEEYVKASFWKRLAYRLYRNPFIMFGLGPIYILIILNRFNAKDARRKERISTYITNLFIVALYVFMCFAIGWKAFIMIQAPILFVSGVLGIWLFYVQHQFEDSYFEEEENWDYVKAAIDGSSYYKLPKVFQWITGNIGFHHVHHLSSKIPNYNLEKVHKSITELKKATTIKIGSSLKSLRFKLWDERRKTFITFKELKKFYFNRKVNVK
ncbi:fatty acid desaturase [Chengkuizengella axinellae]|uniref:Fatty acid desaturase n=1 Tax=Chengkuizengella axinellae TaxID=3064388 RepID=A0ABT9J1R7_9BACL|nr:fatty acid desaturase [Chengkuizengella sp. 2205SS18-9]MDP5275525.1 fatty acid desaturase [Chengkuizengella sp. 2205SS18-9]